MSLTLNLKHGDEITLPSWIGASELTLEEIGAIACMSCLETADGELPGMSLRLQSKPMQEAMKSLQSKRVFVPKMESQKLVLSFDLDAAYPREA